MPSYKATHHAPAVVTVVSGRLYINGFDHGEITQVDVVVNFDTPGLCTLHLAPMAPPGERAPRPDLTSPHLRLEP